LQKSKSKAKASNSEMKAALAKVSGIAGKAKQAEPRDGSDKT